MINKEEFLDTVFEEMPEDEHVCVSRQVEKKDSSGVWFKNHMPDDRQFRKYDPTKQDQAWYFCVSSVNGELNEKGTMIKRGRANLMAVYCLVLDDIGTKADPPPVEPSWKIETSPGNFQWGWFIERYTDLGRYEALLEYCHGKGWGDAGAGGSYRLMRVPGSTNLKPGRQKFKSVITHWSLDVWAFDDLADELGCDLNQIAVKDVVVDKTGGAVAMDGIDPLLDWLVDAGSVVKDSGGEWIDIVCPWADRHTSGENIAGYSPLGRGSGKYVQTRSYHCLHEHCVDKTTADFRKKCVDDGGPAVAGFDPLPWLQACYVYVELGQLVYDLSQRPVGGIWQWPLEDFKKKHPGKMTAPGHDRPVLIANAFLESDATRRAVDRIYQPVERVGDKGLVGRYGQTYVNTYVPPNWSETDALPEIFLEHMDYLFPKPEEREIFKNWLAYKIQHPSSRSYGVAMVAEDAYGTGRSWLKDMLSAVLQGGVNTATLPQLYGAGTSAEQTYNDWKSGCQFLVVEEGKDNDMSRDDFYHGYETFKQNCDTKVSRDQRINPKFGRTRTEDIYYNVLIFSNHADAMVLSSEDRRVCVLTNPTERQSYDYYERLMGCLDGGEARKIYWWLMRRDVSKYDRIYPPMTAAKEIMISDTRSPAHEILAHIRDNHGPDLVTRGSLKVAVTVAARALDYEKHMREPGAIVKIIWKMLKSIRTKNPKSGAKYTVDNVQQEVRALRRFDIWGAVDEARDAKKVVAELKKAEIVSNVVVLG